MKRVEFESEVLAQNILGRIRQWGYPVEETAEGGYFIREK